MYTISHRELLHYAKTRAESKKRLEEVVDLTKLDVRFKAGKLSWGVLPTKPKLDTKEQTDITALLKELTINVLPLEPKYTGKDQEIKKLIVGKQGLLTKDDAKLIVEGLTVDFGTIPRQPSSSLRPRSRPSTLARHSSLTSRVPVRLIARP